jgi:hypothetical protein
MLFLKRCSDVFDAEREKIVGAKAEQGMVKEKAESEYGENPDFYDGFFVPERARLNLLAVAEKVKALINAHVSARGVDPKVPPTMITDAEFEKVFPSQISRCGRWAFGRTSPASVYGGWSSGYEN